MATKILQRFDEIESGSIHGLGALESPWGNLPLKQLGYQSRVVGLAVRTIITQSFYNPFDQPIEATYIFPIEGEQAVVDCEMHVNGRIVRARLKERGKARAEYRTAIRAGHRAALLEENRPETFSMKVGNIPAGQAVQVRIETVGTLPVVAGEWTLRLPLVVAPRYTSGLPLPRMQSGSGTAVDTNHVPDASTVTPPVCLPSPSWLPGFANPVDLTLSVELAPSNETSAADGDLNLRSSLHAVVVDSHGEGVGVKRATLVRVLPGERIDRDFILRGSVRGEIMQATLALEISDSPDGTLSTTSGAVRRTTFAVNLVAPRAVTQAPRDVLFLLDRSGSMGGWKIAAARRGISRLVDTLTPNDRFLVWAFDDKLDCFRAQWQHATDATRFEAIRWLGQINDRGGTEMEMALGKAIAAFDAARNRDNVAQGPRQKAVVLVTDGQITGEDSLLRAMTAVSGGEPPRLYCLGVDRAVNGSVLQRLAKFTGGTYELVESEKRLDETLRRFGQEIGAPAVTDLEVRGTDGVEIDISPKQTQTLYAERSLSIYGRLADGESRDNLSLEISGKLANGLPWRQRVTAAVNGTATARPILAPLWGRVRVRELEDELVARGDRHPELVKAIVDCSLETHVLSRLTAFVAVDETERVTSGERTHSVTQPVATPEGWTWLPPLDGGVLLPIPRTTGSFAHSSTRDRKFTKELARHLVEMGVVSQEQLSVAEGIAQHKNISATDALILAQYATEAVVNAALAAVYSVPSIDLATMNFQREVIQIVPESVARECAIIPLFDSHDTITVAISSPTDLETVEKLQFILNKRIAIMLAPREAIQKAIGEQYQATEGESADSIMQEFTDTQIDFTVTSHAFDRDDDGIQLGEDDTLAARPAYDDSRVTRSGVWRDAGDQDHQDFDGDDLADICQASEPMFDALPRRPAKLPAQMPHDSAPIVKLVNMMLSEAVRLRATRIVIAPDGGSLQISYVIDGKTMLRDCPPKRLESALVTRLMILAKLDPAQKTTPQASSIKVTVGETEVDVVIAFTPGPDGTRVVMDLTLVSE